MARAPSCASTAAAALLLGFMPGLCWALDLASLAGQWTVTWPNATHNSVSLLYDHGNLSGTYINDSGARCSTLAMIDATTSAAAIQVQCPTWAARMEGTVSADG